MGHQKEGWQEALGHRLSVRHHFTHTGVPVSGCKERLSRVCAKRPFGAGRRFEVIVFITASAQDVFGGVTRRFYRDELT
jgi:hypothetical protein